MHIWHSRYHDWVTVARHKVKIWVSRKSTTFILRFPHVRHCVDLGLELQFREDRRRAYYGLLPVLSREVNDVRVPRPEKIGDNFIVVAYPAVSHPRLPQHLLVRCWLRVATTCYPQSSSCSSINRLAIKVFMNSTAHIFLLFKQSLSHRQHNLDTYHSLSPSQKR